MVWLVCVGSSKQRVTTMFRMIIAAFTVYLLLPENVTLLSNGSEPVKPVSAGQTLDAANTVLKDITGFCERNPDTCDTGKALLVNAKKAVSGTINTELKDNGLSPAIEGSTAASDTNNATSE